MQSPNCDTTLSHLLSLMGETHPISGRRTKQTGYPREELCHRGQGHSISGWCLASAWLSATVWTEHKVEQHRMAVETPHPEPGKETHGGERNGHHCTDSMVGDQCGTDI